MKRLLLIATHGVALGLGFALGIYALPILIAPEAPTAQQVQQQKDPAGFEGRFRRDLAGSDALHWGDGVVTVDAGHIGLVGELAPGPDYRLYLSPEFVETEADFLRLRAGMVQVGAVRTFKNFLVPVPPTIDPSRFNTVIVWCEAFGQFITAARYR